MYPVARPAGYEPFGVRHSRGSILNHITFNILPLTFTEGGVVLCTQVDGEDSILPENVSSQSSQPSHALVVHGLRDEVRLEEPNTCGRQFNGVFEIGADQVVHPHHTLVGMLQDVDGRIVRVVSQHVAQGERMDVNVFRLNRKNFRTLYHYRYALVVTDEFRLYLDFLRSLLRISR